MSNREKILAEIERFRHRRELVMYENFDRLAAERDALQTQVKELEAENAELRKRLEHTAKSKEHRLCDCGGSPKEGGAHGHFYGIYCDKCGVSTPVEGSNERAWKAWDKKKMMKEKLC